MDVHLLNPILRLRWRCSSASSRELCYLRHKNCSISFIFLVRTASCKESTLLLVHEVLLTDERAAAFNS